MSHIDTVLKAADERHKASCKAIDEKAEEDKRVLEEKTVASLTSKIFLVGDAE